MQNMPSGIYEQWKLRSSCAFMQSDQGFHCPLTKSLDTTECMKEEQRHAQVDQNLRIFVHGWRNFFAWHGPYNYEHFMQNPFQTIRSDQCCYYTGYGSSLMGKNSQLCCNYSQLCLARAYSGLILLQPDWNHAQFSWSGHFLSDRVWQKAH